jgi:hypothetical protein
MSGIFKHIGSGGVNGNSTSIGCGIGLFLTHVQCQGVKLPILLGLFSDLSHNKIPLSEISFFIE